MEPTLSTEKDANADLPTVEDDADMENGTSGNEEGLDDEDSRLQNDLQSQLAQENQNGTAEKSADSTPVDFAHAGGVLRGASYFESTEAYEVPPNIARIRDELFELRQPIELSVEEHNIYWPYIDNVWVKQRTSVTRDKLLTSDYYCCRQRERPGRRTGEKTRGQPYPDVKRRHRSCREGPTCNFQIKVVKFDGVFPSVTISRQVTCASTHTHDLEHMDNMKRNSGLLAFVKREAEQGYIPASILTKFRENADVLAAVGGKHLTGVDVRNICSKWRTANTEAELRIHQGYQFQNGIGVYKLGSRPEPQIDPSRPSQPRFTLVSHPADALTYPQFSLDFLQPYLPTREANRKFPHITLTYAQSMDGKISLARGAQTALSGPESKAMTHYLRSRHDAILIGVGTAVADNPGLNCRLEGAGGYGGLGKMWQPRPVIVDPTGRWPIDPECRLLKTVLAGKGKSPWIVVSPGANIPADRILLMKKHGGDFLRIAEFNPAWRLRWATIFGALAAEGITSIMIEGGGVILSELLNSEYEDFIDSIIVTVAPVYLGRGGVGAAPDSKRDEQGKAKVSLKPKEVKWQQLGQDMIMCSKERLPPPPPILAGIEDAALGLPGE